MTSKFDFQSMGCLWSVSISDYVSTETLSEIETVVVDDAARFDGLYSRFKEGSLVRTISKSKGRYTVPEDLVVILRLYQRLNRLSDGKFNPLVGFSIEDTGYDSNYSLIPKERIRDTPNFDSSLKILSENEIETFVPVLIDIGAMGKGFFVDKISTFLKDRGLSKFLVNGSGDIYYSGGLEFLNVGLEHPLDFTKVVGVLPISEGSVCASATGRRDWESYNHIFDPQTKTSPREILASWVYAETACLADALATCIFLVAPEVFEKEFKFEYLLLNSEMRVKRSTGFNAHLF